MNTAQLAKEWLRLDREEITRQEIQTLITQDDQTELQARLATRLAFGTAGLRAEMGAGFSRINSLTIIQTTQGLANYLLHHVHDAQTKGVVVGFDARHQSSHFARLVAAALIAYGIHVWFLEDLAYTPLVSFGVKYHSAAGGIMITASHNPAKDNGYKVYGPNSCQINTPVDKLISQFILQSLEPRTWDTSTLSKSPLYTESSKSLSAAYISALQSFILPNNIEPFRPPQFVYTPLHGVGLRHLEAALAAVTTDPSFITVPAQAQPDPDFPTLSYPNPEEAGALDLAVQLADEKKISLIVANDPDADRFAAAEKIPGSTRWHQFTGDQIGILLAYSILSNERSKSCTLTTAVSSQMLHTVAHSLGHRSEETLTGFKWLGARATALDTSKERCGFAYEEALGYMFPSVVLDKDGICAAMVFLQACTSWKSPWTMLQSLYEQYGYHVTMNTYWRSPSVAATEDLFRQIRIPVRMIAQRSVCRWRDLGTGFDSKDCRTVSNTGLQTPINPQKDSGEKASGEPRLPSSPSTRMVTAWLDAKQGDTGVKFTIRASGTEPKIKIYLECVGKADEPARKGASEVLRWIHAEWFSADNVTIEEKYTRLVTCPKVS